MNVVDFWKHLERDVPGCHRPFFGIANLRLSFLKSSENNDGRVPPRPDPARRDRHQRAWARRIAAMTDNHVFRERREAP